MHIGAALMSALGMMILILDAKTAISGATEGISLCISTVIPSLFPFFLLSILLTGSMSGVRISLLHPLCRLLKIPESAGSIWIIGLLGGYPTGAQSIALACQKGNLSKIDASRMIAFCNNAGPAFIFGIGAVIFEDVWICLMLWLIHILSALIVGIMTPANKEQNGTIATPSSISLTQALKKALQTMALVCGWVVIFRIILAFLFRWFLWLLPEVGQTVLSGILELTNGCCMLSKTENMGMNFLLFSAFLSFGGLCVAIQTYSVTAGSGIDLSLYLPAKIAQAAVSILLCGITMSFLPPQYQCQHEPILPLFSMIVCVCYSLFAKRTKKTVAFPKVLMYNKEKSR